MKNKTNEQKILEARELIRNLLSLTYPDWERVQQVAAVAAKVQEKHISEVRKRNEKGNQECL